MVNYEIFKYWSHNTISDYEKIRHIAYKENIENNILVGTVEKPKYELFLLYKDWTVVWFWWYNVSNKELLSHNYTIENLYILKELQWQWLMAKLFNFIQEDIKKSGKKIIRLEAKVVETNSPSLKFFEKNWFYKYWFAKNRVYDKKNWKYIWTVLLEKIINI